MEQVAVLDMRYCERYGQFLVLQCCHLYLPTVCSRISWSSDNVTDNTASFWLSIS